MYSVYLEQLWLNTEGKSSSCAVSSKEFTDYIIEKAPLDFNTPFVDNMLLYVFDKYVFDNIDSSVNNFVDNNVDKNKHENTVTDKIINIFFSELFLLTKKMPTSAALLEIAENKVSWFCAAVMSFHC